MVVHRLSDRLLTDKVVRRTARMRMEDLPVAARPCTAYVLREMR